RPFDPPDPVQSLGGSQIAAITLGQSAWSLHFLGEDHAADNHAAMALALAQAGNDAPTLSLAWFFSANLRRWQRNWSQLLPEAEAMLAAAQQPTLHAIAELLRDAARVNLDQPAIADGDQALATVLTHTPMHEITARSVLAEIALAQGDLAAVKLQCQTALAAAERLGNDHANARLLELLAHGA
ncbi:MAG: hypothetical protein PHH11_10170, partial [Methylomonas sp.]|nr:hypothetical protein [Methylomonas sp.]